MYLNITAIGKEKKTLINEVRSKNNFYYDIFFFFISILCILILMESEAATES